MGKVIGILSLKGGVGKTSSVVALGSALASFGQKVLLIDGNFSAPNLGVHLNYLNPERTIHDVLSGERGMPETIIEHPDFHVIAAKTYPKKNFDPLKLEKAIDQIRDNYDFILIDSSPALNNETLATMLASDELFVVTTPDYSTLSMTLKAINLAKKQGTNISGIILNKIYNKNFELGIEDIEDAAGVPVLAVIPHDEDILKAQAYFVSPIDFKPKSQSSTEYKKLAATLADKKYRPFRMREMFQISPKRQEINREIFYRSMFNKD